MSATGSAGRDGYVSVPSSSNALASCSSSVPSEQKKELERAQSLGQLIEGSTSTEAHPKLTRQVSMDSPASISMKIGEASHPIFHGEDALEQAKERLRHFFGSPGPSVSGSMPGPSSLKLPTLDDLARNAEGLLLHNGRVTDPSSAGPSSSTTPSLTGDTKSNLERAVRAVDLLVEFADELRLEGKPHDHVITLIEKLERAIIEERSEKVELIKTLCEKLSPDEIHQAGLDRVVRKESEYGRSNVLNQQYQAQGDLIKSFDKIFYNEASFKALARICGEKTRREGSDFRYEKLSEGLGFALTLSVVKQTPEGEKSIPIFVCKPIVAQPGGENYYPYSDPVTETDVTNRIEQQIGFARKQLHANVQPILTASFPGNRLKSHELAQEALAKGVRKDFLLNMTVEEFKGLLKNGLHCKGEFLNDAQAASVLNKFKELFNREIFEWEIPVDVVRDDHASDPQIRDIAKNSMEKEYKENREREKGRAEKMVLPFRGARGVEINHVVSASRTLSQKYPTTFEIPLLSTIIADFPVIVRSPDGERQLLTDTMVMEFCPSYGTLESANKDKRIVDIPQGQFHQDQIEKRFIAGLILGFADQNMGNELIVDKQEVPTEDGTREMVRLASVDMGQSNPVGWADANPPFYGSFQCLKDTKFYENIAARIAGVNFAQLISDVALIYEQNGMPLTKDQIKLMIFRCEMLKALVATKLHNANDAQIKLVKAYPEFKRIVNGPQTKESFSKLVVSRKNIIQSFFTKRRGGVKYKIQGKTYWFKPT